MQVPQVVTYVHDKSWMSFVSFVFSILSLAGVFGLFFVHINPERNEKMQRMGALKKILGTMEGFRERQEQLEQEKTAFSPENRSKTFPNSPTRAEDYKNRRAQLQKDFEKFETDVKKFLESMDVQVSVQLYFEEIGKLGQKYTFIVKDNKSDTGSMKFSSFEEYKDSMEKWVEQFKKYLEVNIPSEFAYRTHNRRSSDVPVSQPDKYSTLAEQVGAFEDRLSELERQVQAHHVAIDTLVADAQASEERLRQEISKIEGHVNSLVLQQGGIDSSDPQYDKLTEIIKNRKKDRRMLTYLLINLPQKKVQDVKSGKNEDDRPRLDDSKATETKKKEPLIHGCCYP